MNAYKTIGKKEKDKVLADYIRAQEMDHMLFVMNLERFKKIRDTYPNKSSQFYNKVCAEIPVLESRVSEVENILNNTYSEITDEDLQIAINGTV